MDCEACARQLYIPREATVLWWPSMEDGYIYDRPVPLCDEHARAVTEGVKRPVRKGSD